MSGLVNKVKEALSSDRKHGDTTANTTTTGTSAVHGDPAHAHTATTGPAPGTDGPHSSNLMNKADPRVDSDRDTSRNMGANPQRDAAVHGTHTTGTTGGTTGMHTTDPRHQTTTGTGVGTGMTGGTTTGTHSTGTHTATSGPAPGTDGPHKSNLMNKLDPRVDSDRDASRNMGANPQRDAAIHSTGTTGTTGGYTSGTHQHQSTAGTGLGTSGGTMGTHTMGPQTTTTTGSSTRTDGPHNSDMMNKLDPRVDSDRDASRNMGANPQRDAAIHSTGNTGTTGAYTTGTHHQTTAPHTGTTGTHHQTTAPLTGTTGTTGAYSTGAHHQTTTPHTSTTTGTTSGTDGPHNSNLMNKLDPRVDSDRDASRNMGANPQRDAAIHSTGTTGAHTTGTHHQTSGTGFGSGAGTTAGGLTGGTTHTMGTTTGAPQGTHGPHGGRLANTADPRVDSDRDGRAATHHHQHTTHHHGSTGPAPNTAGPHSSDAMNKADPRVDSNLDGSKTLGQDKTFDQSGVHGARKDPTDATQVPPSTLQQHVGPPREL